jgi:hypothetical protein
MYNPKVKKFGSRDGSIVGYSYECPGCKQPHALVTKDVSGNSDMWHFEGPTESPSFFPSVLYKDERYVCHSLVRNGQIQFLHDCTHGLAGQIVDMLDMVQQ